MKKLLPALILLVSLCRITGYAQSCLLDYQTKMDQLLPLATIQKHYKGDLSKAELKYRKSQPKYAKNDSYEYRWNSDRIKKMTINGQQMEIPDHNRIGLRWIDEVNAKYHPDPILYFKNFYRTATEAEKQQAAALIDKKLKEKELNSTEQVAGKNVSNTLLGTKGYETIPGVGDAAAWDLSESQLVVLKGRTTFKIVAAIGSDMKTNQELAKKLAEEVLAKCR